MLSLRPRDHTWSAKALVITKQIIKTGPPYVSDWDHRAGDGAKPDARLPAGQGLPVRPTRNCERCWDVGSAPDLPGELVGATRSLSGHATLA